MKNSFEINIENATLGYKYKLNENVIIKDLSFRVESGETLCILGSNGSGKTTILNSICGITTPLNGTISFTRDNNNKLPRIAFVNQDYRQSNLPWASIIENISYPLKFIGYNKQKRYEIGDKILTEIMPSVNPMNKLYTLSGGQQQLIAIARAIASEADILICDEPLSAVDIIRANKALKIVEQFKLNNSIPIIWISHNIDEAFLMGDKIALLSKNEKGFHKIINNPLEYPRHPENLLEHSINSIKKEILRFLTQESN